MATTTKPRAQKPFNARQWGIGGDQGKDLIPPPDPRSEQLRCIVSAAKARYVSPDQSFAIWSAVWDRSDLKDELTKAVAALRKLNSDPRRLAELEKELKTSSERPVTIKGALARISSGEMLICKGRWKKHAKYGWSFEVSDYTSALPVDDQGVAMWLQTRVDGVGPTFAKAIVKHFGAENVYEVLDADPTKLREVKTDKGRALAKKQVEAAIAAWDEAKAIRQIETFLFSHGVSAKRADQLYRHYGEEVIDILTNTPYRISELRGIGFKIADGIARSMGVKVDDPARVEAAIMYCLEKAEEQGHVFLTLDQMTAGAGMALKFEETGETAGPKAIIEGASRLAAKAKIKVEDDEHLKQRIYAEHWWDTECRVARTVREMLNPTGHMLFPRQERPTAPEGATPEEAEALKLPSDEQWSLIDLVRANRLSLLSGGPGVGKCIRGDQAVIVDGSPRQIKDVWAECAKDVVFDGEGFWAKPSRALRVPTVDEDGVMREADVSRLYRQKVSEIGRRVRLQDGSELVMTKRHRLLGPTGWSNEPAVGDHVAVPRLLSHGRHAVDPDLVHLIAWQITEGYEGKDYPDPSREGRLKLSGEVRITQKDRSVLDDLVGSVEAALGGLGLARGEVKVTEAPTGRAHYLRFSSTAYRRWLEANGFAWAQPSRLKRIPDFLMEGDKSTVRLLLRDLFAAEGSISLKGRALEITSASPVMMEQIRTLLRRFGVLMRVRTKRARATNGAGIWRNYQVGTVSGPSLRTFADLVGVADASKSTRLQTCVGAVANANLETIPLHDLLVEAKEGTGLSRRHFGLTSSYFTEPKALMRPTAEKVRANLQEILDGSRAQERSEVVASLPERGGHQREYAASTTAALDALDSSWFADLLERFDRRLKSDLQYVKVTEVEDVALDGWVYDFEVPVTHSYVAGGMCCHNTASQAWLMQIAEKADMKVHLCAPTGKAARRMAEATGHEAKTIHRLLEYSPFEGGFQRDEENPLKGDLLIVDECSMLQLDLADSLLRAIPQNMHVLLVGDPDQLPPVGAGKVFDDLINSEAVPRVHLNKIFRQAAKSMIIQNARRLNTGQLPYLKKEEAEAELGNEMLNDFFWVPRKTPESTLAMTIDMTVNRIPRTFGFDPRTEIMVLAPQRGGKVGLHVLNSELELKLNSAPDGSHKKPIVNHAPVKVNDQLHQTGLCVGSRVVQTKNMYHPDGPDKSVMNGEVGMIVDHNEGSSEALLRFEDGREFWLPTSDMDSFQLAWALTIHRSQGSQWPCVVAPVSTSHYAMLSRNLEYVAVTRAEKLCLMVGEVRALQMAVGKKEMQKRNSTLVARINEPALSGELF